MCQGCQAHSWLRSCVPISSGTSPRSEWERWPVQCPCRVLWTPPHWTLCVSTYPPRSTGLSSPVKGTLDGIQAGRSGEDIVLARQRSGGRGLWCLGWGWGRFSFFAYNPIRDTVPDGAPEREGRVGTLLHFFGSDNYATSSSNLQARLAVGVIHRRGFVLACRMCLLNSFGRAWSRTSTAVCFRGPEGTGFRILCGAWRPSRCQVCKMGSLPTTREA